MNPFKYFGKSYALWLILIAIGTAAFFLFPNATGLNWFLTFLGAAGSANTYRASRDDNREIEMKKIEVTNGKITPTVQ